MSQIEPEIPLLAITTDYVPDPEQCSSDDLVVESENQGIKPEPVSSLITHRVLNLFSGRRKSSKSQDSEKSVVEHDPFIFCSTRANCPQCQVKSCLSEGITPACLACLSLRKGSICIRKEACQKWRPAQIVQFNEVKAAQVADLTSGQSPKNQATKLKSVSKSVSSLSGFTDLVPEHLRNILSSSKHQLSPSLLKTLTPSSKKREETPSLQRPLSTTKGVTFPPSISSTTAQPFSKQELRQHHKNQERLEEVQKKVENEIMATAAKARSSEKEKKRQEEEVKKHEQEALERADKLRDEENAFKTGASLLRTPENAAKITLDQHLKSDNQILANTVKRQAAELERLRSIQRKQIDFDKEGEKDDQVDEKTEREEREARREEKLREKEEREEAEWANARKEIKERDEKEWKEWKRSQAYEDGIPKKLNKKEEYLGTH